MSFEQLPYLALSKTYSANQQTPDSAPTMSAIITGVKTNDGMLSIDSRVHRKETDGLVLKTHQIKTLIEQAEDHGLSTGIVTTTRITHATPAACYAHISERDWETDAMIPSGSTVPDIALQFVDFDHGDGIDVTLGGGARTFCRKRSPILKSLEKPACEKTEET